MQPKQGAFLIFWTGLFAIGMAFVESAVVVYLRELYYPGGFDFPLEVIHTDIAITEIIREAATLLMLVSVGILAGRTATEKFGLFLFIFALWDIFYYVFLKALLNWPSSWLEWDVLFLIPVTWVGPVIAPILNSVIMIALGVFTVIAVEKKGAARINTAQWWLLIIGALLVLMAYMEDYVTFMSGKMPFYKIFTLEQNRLEFYLSEYVPEDFSWILYLSGLVLHVVAVFLFGKNVFRRSYSL